MYTVSQKENRTPVTLWHNVINTASIAIYFLLASIVLLAGVCCLSSWSVVVCNAVGGRPGRVDGRRAGHQVREQSGG